MHFTFTGRTVQANLARSGQTAHFSTHEPSAAELVPTLRVLLNSALSSGNRKNYQRAWATFNEFYKTFYHSADPELPLTALPLALFIAYLHACKLAPSSIKSYLSAIGYVHKMKGLPDPPKAFLIEKLLTALGRQVSSDIRVPISRPVLHELVGSVHHTSSSAFQRILFSAVFLMAFYGFFRIGELAAKSTNAGGSVVQYSNMRFLTQQGLIHMVKITITNFKHNTNNRPFDILIEREDSLPMCPVQAMVDYCNLRGSKAGPLFAKPIQAQ